VRVTKKDSGFRFRFSISIQARIESLSSISIPILYPLSHILYPLSSILYPSITLSSDPYLYPLSSHGRAIKRYLLRRVRGEVAEIVDSDFT